MQKICTNCKNMNLCKYYQAHSDFIAKLNFMTNYSFSEMINKELANICKSFMEVK